MKQAIFYVILFLFFLVPGCSSKQNTRTTASVKENGNTAKDEVKTTVKKDEITITAPDNVKLAADYYYNENNKDSKQPLVILIHQFRQSKEQWSEGFIDSLVNSGYKVLAYDIRGHGQSEKVNYPLSDLLTDPEKAPKDVDGVFDWARKQDGVDSSRIGAVGTSIGGNLACYARSKLGAKTVISVSNSADGFEKFLGIDPRMMSMRMMVRLKSFLFICGSRDGDHEKDERYIMDNYIAEPMELKVYDSDKHGIFLIRVLPEIRSLMLSWLKKYL